MDPKAAGMFNDFALRFAMGFVLATVVAVLLPNDWGVLFLPAGLVAMAVAFVAGGGVSIRTPASTPVDLSTRFARVEMDIRFGERNVNRNLILGGGAVGAAMALAGLAAFLV